MEILLWLVPPLVVTCAAMAWVSWVGRHSQREVDREVAVRRLSQALSPERHGRRPVGGYAARLPERDRSTGIAVRPSRARGGTDAPPVRRAG